ncbi:MAG TPA: sugar phosphate isomerase/epimerase [Bryobacteraceae bacterium]|jgi:inosose dehydratase|nr:sugar phosphate isomerase/epimerase [Bryobacteraceae bacterium]
MLGLPHNRRSFLRHLAALAGPVAGLVRTADAQPKRRLRVGHTGITWGYTPDGASRAIPEVASLGYYGYETFGEYLEPWEAKGGLKAVLDANHLPLVSAYCNVNLTDASQRSAEVAKIIRWTKLIKECGGVTAVIGPNGVKRATYDFKAAKSDVVAALNDIAKAITDAGLTAALHQHTGTCVETRDEVYATLDAVDTRYVKFGPDVGQLAKGGSDPVKVVKDYLQLIRHVHLKDWDGGKFWAEYCPLGRGKVDLPAVLDLLEQAPEMKVIMVELDAGPGAPLTPIETARISKEYLQKQGYAFRT